jgi:hypothetical protein
VAAPRAFSGGHASARCGVNIGITRAADDINPFMGISWRF